MRVAGVVLVGVGVDGVKPNGVRLGVGVEVGVGVLVGVRVRVGLRVGARVQLLD